MTDRREIERRLARLEQGGITRREFARRAIALGLGAGAAGPLLAACGERSGRVEDEAGAPGDIEHELHIYNWSDYIADDTVAGFEREFGVRVTYDTYESNEEMVARLQAGAAGYDIIVPSGYVLPVLTATGLIRPLSRPHLTNWANLAPIFLNPPADPGNVYSVPWQWGTTGIAYRRDKVAGPIESWGVFHDPRHAGKMTMMDDSREVIGAFLRYRGHSLNSTDPRALAQARADAIEAKRHLRAYISAPVKAQLIAGDVWIAQLWNGDTAQARAEQPALAYVVPREGSTIWSDSMCIPRGARHVRAAHEWINYILRPEIGAAISEATGFGTPNAAAAPLVRNPVPYPTEAELRRLEYPLDLGRDTELWDRIWTEIKAG